MHLTDSNGRVYTFKGKHLVSESTDNGRVARWVDTDVWRTVGGAYVVLSAFQCRLVHTDVACTELWKDDISEIRVAGIPCRVCDPEQRTGRYGVATRHEVNLADSPGDLIHSLKDDNGRVSKRNQEVLAALSDEDEAVRALWMTVEVA